MAVSRFIGGRNRTPSDLRQITEYTLNSDKVPAGCSGTTGLPLKQWTELTESIKTIFNKADKRQYISFIIGFSPEDEDKPIENAIKACVGIAEYFDESAVLYGIHTNTEHRHAHFIVNTTSLKDGSQLSFSKNNLGRFNRHCTQKLNEVGFGGIISGKIKTDCEAYEDISDFFELEDEEYYIDEIVAVELDRSAEYDVITPKKSYRQQMKLNIEQADEDDYCEDYSTLQLLDAAIPPEMFYNAEYSYSDPPVRPEAVEPMVFFDNDLNPLSQPRSYTIYGTKDSVTKHYAYELNFTVFTRLYGPIPAMIFFYKPEPVNPFIFYDEDGNEK